MRFKKTYRALDIVIGAALGCILQIAMLKIYLDLTLSTTDKLSIFAVILYCIIALNINTPRK